ncbi:hypothetical protein [Streptomyces phaeochromogenes]|uniref:hypothetical protein n=1 Tax=Streptomyces phaeochromogenes TaxID=1923 RepID=UPI0006E45C9D|nr:hypothetical protein [Streptomyces phaeochromogenes]
MCARAVRSRRLPRRENTWTKAGTWLRNSAGGTTGTTVSYYISISNRIYLSRGSDGYYHFTDGTESGRIAGYNYRTCS